jgi:hypothetical protein
MTVVTDRDKGLFPLPREISLKCNCPDWAVMCKHVAAVLYGVGARLDEKPDLLFLLRGVDHEELISAEVGVAAATGKAKGMADVNASRMTLWRTCSVSRYRKMKHPPGRRQIDARKRPRQRRLSKRGPGENLDAGRAHPRPGRKPRHVRPVQDELTRMPGPSPAKRSPGCERSSACHEASWQGFLV